MRMSSTTFIAGLFVGGVLGAAVAALYAPTEGQALSYSLAAQCAGTAADGR